MTVGLPTGSFDSERGRLAVVKTTPPWLCLETWRERRKVQRWAEMNVRLVSMGVRTSQKEIVLDAFPATIGRGPAVQVRLDDPFVSRCHCEIDEMEGVLVVHDLGSKNGTYVNGCRITEALLMPGHELSLGKVHFLVCYESDGVTARACAEHELAYQCRETPIVAGESGWRFATRARTLNCILRVWDPACWAKFVGRSPSRVKVYATRAQ